MRDVIITIPKTVNWNEYKKELEAAHDGAIMNYKVTHLPKESGVGAKCWIVYNGYILGYMIICGLQKNNFTCTTTGKQWEGKFIQRTGEFFNNRDLIPMKGFQGWRYYDN